MDLKKRLSAIIQKDKETNPKYLEEVIKSDIFYLISNYFEVDLSDINVEIGLINNKYEINISCFGDKIKLFKILPS